MSAPDHGHRRLPCRRPFTAVTAALFAVAGLSVGASPAGATHDGPPAFAGFGGTAFSPSTVPLAGAPHRIYGSGFSGVTKVEYVWKDAAGNVLGSALSPNFAVVTGTLMLAQAPPAPSTVPSNTFADVALTDDEATTTASGAFYYTEATISASPNSGLNDLDKVMVSVRNYAAVTSGIIAIAEASPLMGYAEPRPTDAPPPYVDVVGQPPYNLGSFDYEVTVRAEPNFNTDGDPTAQCPPTQAQANAGLVTCSLAYSRQGIGTIATPVSFAANPAPEAAVVALSASSATVGASISIDGARSINWGGNPSFGSSTSPTRPGETPLTVELCAPDGTGCVAASGSARVSLVRYLGAAPNFHDGTLAGAALSGSFTVPSGGCTGSCVVRVRQQAFRQPSGTYVEATAPLSVATAVKRAVADFDGDGDTDISVWRPSNGGWYVKDGSTTYFGLNGDNPVPADYDGVVGSDLAVFRPANGGWYRPGHATVYFGRSGDIPVPADYDHDADADIAVFRPANGGWYIAGQPTTYLGIKGDIPVPADYDNDGDADIAVFRPSNGGWYIAGQPTKYFGISGDIPVPGDYDNDGDADIAVFRPANGGWYVAGQPTTYFGLKGDVPVSGDYNADGKADIAVFRPGNGGWYRLGQPTVYFGRSGDIALPLPYAIYQAFFVAPAA